MFFMQKSLTRFWILPMYTDPPTITLSYRERSAGLPAFRLRRSVSPDSFSERPLAHFSVQPYLLEYAINVFILSPPFIKFQVSDRNLPRYIRIRISAKRLSRLNR